jgi:MinD superfamily P-loop ATPase
MMPLINGYLVVLGKIQINTRWHDSTRLLKLTNLLMLQAVKIENRVEVPAPTVADATAENKAAAVAKAKKAPAKKTADKKPAVKKAPAKKKST